MLRCFRSTLWKCLSMRFAHSFFLFVWDTALHVDLEKHWNFSWVRDHLKWKRPWRFFFKVKTVKLLPQHVETKLLKCLWASWHHFERYHDASYAHQGCIYFIKNTLKPLSVSFMLSLYHYYKTIKALSIKILCLLDVKYIINTNVVKCMINVLYSLSVLWCKFQRIWWSRNISYYIHAVS